MKIVMLERASVGLDISWGAIEKLGEAVFYETTKPEQVAERIADADIVVLNKCKMDENSLKDAKNLKLICVAATGVNCIDWEYCNKRGIVVTNVPNYCTEVVAQHTFALALNLLEKLDSYVDFVHSGDYSKSNNFCIMEPRFFEIAGKTWGIVGMGNIGKRVAKIAEAFGANVCYYSPSGNTHRDVSYPRVEFDEFLEKSDIVSLHCPLSSKTEKLFGKTQFEKMKDSAILVNVARGPIVDEEALAAALLDGKISGAGLDVFAKEPMDASNSLLKVKDKTKLILTPHMAWCSVEARVRCIDIMANNIKNFLAGTPTCVFNGM